LRTRLDELAHGLPVTTAAAQQAKARAGEALERARRAHHAAANRHVDAEEAHLRAAAVHEQVAMQASDRNVSVDRKSVV